MVTTKFCVRDVDVVVVIDTELVLRLNSAVLFVWLCQTNTLRHVYTVMIVCVHASFMSR